LETSKWESSCLRIDEQGAALASLPRAIWSGHHSIRYEGCTRCFALLLRCMFPRGVCLDRACLTTAGPRSPHLMQIRGRTPGKRRERTTNEGKTRNRKRARTTFVGPLDTPSVGRGPLSSASPADWLQLQILAHELRLLIDCLLLLARCRLRLRRTAVPPPQVAPKLSFLLTSRPNMGKDCPRRGTEKVEQRKVRRFYLSFFFARSIRTFYSSCPLPSTAAVYAARQNAILRDNQNTARFSNMPTLTADSKQRGG